MPVEADDPAHRPGGEGGGDLALAPFRGTRYSPDVVGDLGSVTSPPYDLIDDREVARLAAADPHNVVRLILPREDAQHPGERYAQARRTLDGWLADGVLITDPEPALYVYEQHSPADTQRGLLGGLGLVPPEAGAVLPHEDVLPGPVADRLALMRATAANLEPIFCVYEGGGPASDLVDEVASTAAPTLRLTTDDGVTHRLWTVTGSSRHALVARDLRGRQALIADGHHRYATYLRLQAEYRAAGRGAGPWDYGLALLVDSTRYPPRLDAIHRVVPDLDPADALAALRRVGRIVPLDGGLSQGLRALEDAAGKAPAFLLAAPGQQYLVIPDPEQLASVMPDGRSARWRGLATAVLHAWVIPAVWRRPHPESVRFVHHDAAAAVAEAAKTGGSAVLLAPPSPADVMAIAAHGERVPQKSTSFGPKPRTGLVLRAFGDR